MLKLRRRIARLVLKKGGNALIQFRFSIDHESGGERSDRAKARMLTARGHGTAVFIVKEQGEKAQYEEQKVNFST